MAFKARAVRLKTIFLQSSVTEQSHRGTVVILGIGYRLHWAFLAIQYRSQSRP